MKNEKNIAVVLLAAGQSSRMRKVKQLLPWKNTTLLGNAIQVAKQSKAKHIYVVLGAKAIGIKDSHTDATIHWVVNQDWKKGMGSSIASATAHILKTSIAYDGILIMLCDQPLIDTIYLNELMDTFIKTDKGIVATKYKHGKGVPAVFDKMHFLELGKLTEDYGAKDIILKNLEDMIALNPKGKEKDLDTLQEYNELLNIQRNQTI
ncbi:MAG: nucleotidyltransferase family protein [Maribacter sp.]|nr:nucleotidyltransferase family protein [Maribacter sp.]